MKETLTRTLQEIASRVVSPEHHKALAYAISNGKHVRPAFMERICAELNVDAQPLHDAMAGIELIHAASLVHDDIVDEDVKRREKPSFPAAYGMKNSILYGDYFFVSALQLFSQKKYPREILSHVLSTVQQMTDAQLMEAQEKVVDVESYMHYAAGKTGSLFELCARIPLEYYGLTHHHAISFAQKYGLGFQLSDDLSENKDELCIQRFVGRENATMQLAQLKNEIDAMKFIPSRELTFHPAYSAIVEL
jgi:octaprenyl-diphosphate synthase